jgi:sigma-B regulation protein RsbU (phosphoserine phosphatase)
VILRHVNDELAGQNPHGMFVTIACAVLDPKRGKLSYASAGHPSPVLIRAGQPASYPFASTGMMAGLYPGVEITGIQAEFRPGDALLFYSDGVTEAFNAAGAAFGEPRLLDVAGKVPSSAAEFVAGVFEAVTAFAGDCPQSDDLTLLAVGWPIGGAALP